MNLPPEFSTNPESSAGSVKSDWSKDEPAYLGIESGHRPQQPTAESEKSDWSIEEPPNFSTEPQLRPKIDWSPYFADKPRPMPRLKAESAKGDCSRDSPFLKAEAGCLDMRSIEEPPNFSTEPQPRPKMDWSKDESGLDSVEQEMSKCGSCQKLQGALYRDQPGDPTCSQGGQRSEANRSMNQSAVNAQMYVNLQDVLEEHKTDLRRRCEHITEGTDCTESKILLERIVTELYITEGLDEEVNTQHEVRQLETGSKTRTISDTPIKCCDIFKPRPDQQGPIRVVLTNGVAGIGKTFSVQKFTLDWAEGLENQDVGLVVALSFRELNLIRDQQYSLLKLLHVFHPTLQKITPEKLKDCKLLFIFDGLDESRLSLDFRSTEIVNDVTQMSSVNVLLTNLIQGNLLPSSLIWITSRPAAANQIPPTCLDRVTEVRGFTDTQIDEYFRKRFRDEELSNRVISHIKASPMLHIMCRIPVFCWISATVQEHMLTTDKREELPKTLTDLYSHFLLDQMRRKSIKYHEGSKTQELNDTYRDVLLKLGKLAFEHLEKGNIMFYQEDLEQCGLDVTDALVCSGVCTEIFMSESVILQKSIYCFVHLSVQEFLAAVYMFHCFINRKTDVLQGFLKEEYKSESLLPYPSMFETLFGYFTTTADADLLLTIFLTTAMKKNLKSDGSHLDLFVRFLHGLCLESNQRLLKDLIGQTETCPENIQRIIKNLKEMNVDDISPSRSINVFHCLTEIKDQSVHQEIQQFLKLENRTLQKLSGIHCSALAYMLQMSETVVEELDLEKYNTSVEGRWRLISAVRNCKKARLTGCRLSETHCEVIASALKSRTSPLKELDLSGNYLEDKHVRILSSGLESPHCGLESLRLIECSLTMFSFAPLVLALGSHPSHLRLLNLRGNQLQDSGVENLCHFLKSPHCQLQKLSLSSCTLTDQSCSALVSALKSNPSHLRHLNLSWNHLQDSGVKILCGFLERPDCQLETLKLQSCTLSGVSCFYLNSALNSNPSHLKRMDLSWNQLQDSGVETLCVFLQNPHHQLENLRLRFCGLSEMSCHLLAAVLKSNPATMTNLDLSHNAIQYTSLEQLSTLIEQLQFQGGRL
uniref:NLR family CARD domain-containing protein 3-like n=2 Tax=Cynoglossus semilaevis TaxID=244447 RepID=A0A3P8WGG4_CYNSE